MIEVTLKIKERPASAEGRVACQLDLRIESIKPAPEEVSVAAMVLQKLRELGNEISQQPGTSIRIMETRADPEKQ